MASKEQVEKVIAEMNKDEKFSWVIDYCYEIAENKVDDEIENREGDNNNEDEDEEDGEDDRSPLYQKKADEMMRDIVGTIIDLAKANK